MNKNYAFLNRNSLKYLAVICMLIDHVATAFMPELTPTCAWMHFFGRFTGPIMAFFIVEGYIHTHDLKRYIARMGLFALVSWPCFSYFSEGHLTANFGVIYTLFLGLLAITVYDKFPSSDKLHPLDTTCKWIIILVLFVLSDFGDWAYIDVLVPLGLFILKDKRYGKLLVYGLAQIYYLKACPHWLAIGYIVPAFLLTFFYNGKPGKKTVFNKWFFYIFYPAHLLLLYLIR